MSQQQLAVQVALAQVALAETEPSEPVLPFAVAAALQGTSLAAWARANAPEWLTPQQQEDYVTLFLQAADIYQKWDDAEEGAGLTDLYDIDEEDEGYGGDAEDGAGDGAEASASA